MTAAGYSGTPLQPNAGLWIAWPKRASKVATDLTEDVVRELALASALVDNKVAALVDVLGLGAEGPRWRGRAASSRA